ncbi:MAG: 2-amino-4-hydroxy-6-hydroxymethyldihydropteridine diphosphokinase [Rhizobiales bacterium PAR1]|nr:MAG: 2-amino-4-hydroxy-6-hydroxymethyldihydropteridine diphosphokinase [Rhizobiales bacterium PAR1]
MSHCADTPVPVRAYLALGSNIGDKIEHLRAAVAAVAALPHVRVIARSAIYRTPPWGKTDQDWFANAVIAVETALSPRALLDACLAIEIEQGRVRIERWGPRVIDIDVLIHGEARMATERLTLPHPAMQERAFVLIPLAEIVPELVLDGTPIAERIAGLDSAGIAPIATL